MSAGETQPQDRGKPPKRTFTLGHHRLQEYDYSSPEHAFFVTICALPGTTPFRDPRLADAVVASLMWLRERRGITIYAYCVMHDHVHLLLQLSGDRRTLGTIMGAVKSFTTRESWKLGYRGPLWQERFHDHIVRRSESGRTIAQYILDNPVRKRLASDPNEYAWSGTSDPIE